MLEIDISNSVSDSQRLSSAAMADPPLEKAGIPERMLLDVVRAKSLAENAFGGKLKSGSSGLKTGSSVAAGTRAGRRWNQQVVHKAQGSRLPKKQANK